MTSQVDDVTVIKSMDYEGRGISHIDNKIIFKTKNYMEKKFVLRF